MATYYHRNPQLEQYMLDNISISANKHYNGEIPPEVQERMDVEVHHVVGNGYGTLLAAAAALVEFSAAHGYPIGIRGLVGNLYIAHLLGIAVNDPMKLGLPWEGCLGPDGNWMPDIFLDVPRELLQALRSHLCETLPECDVLFGIPASQTSWGITIVPKASGAYDPDNDYLRFTMCPNDLMERVGKAWRKAGTLPTSVEAFDEDLITRAYLSDVEDIPELGDLDDFQDLACTLEPKSFQDMVKVMGLSLAPEIQFQADCLIGNPDRFDRLIGTREDVYDLCVRHGIGKDDALYIMRRLGGSGFRRLVPKYRDMLSAHGICGLTRNALREVEYLYPRGQCADYIYWALTLLALERRSCRA